MKILSLRKRLIKQRRFRQMLFGSAMLSIVIAFVIVPIERTAQGATIISFSDGLWWTIQTLTTVGYGDVTPVTEVGRVLGMGMQILGTVMFGSLLAIISSSMSRNQEEFYWDRIFERIDMLDKKLTDLEHKTKYLITTETEKIEQIN